MAAMTRKERIAAALNFKIPDRPPHFEQLFQLPMEAFGMDYPDFNGFESLNEGEREKIFERAALVYAKIIEEFKWDMVTVCPPVVPGPYTDPNHYGYRFIPYLKKYLKEYFGEDVPVGTFIWGALICIDAVKDYMEFAEKLYERRSELVEWAEVICVEGLRHARQLLDAGADFIDIASDHAFNKGTFLSPDDFRELVTPYMKRLTGYIQSRGAWVIMHSDGDLAGVMDQILEIRPDVLQSIDPMAGMDIKEVKKQTYGRVALMGNVQCSYLQDGPAEKIIESSMYCLRNCADGGFIYSSSNTIFPGVPLGNYRIMLDCLRQEYSNTF